MKRLTIAACLGAAVIVIGRSTSSDREIGMWLLSMIAGGAYVVWMFFRGVEWIIDGFRER